MKLLIIFFSLLVFPQNILEEKTFLRGRVSMLVPVGFELMARETRQSKYPQGSGMEVFTDEAAEVNVYVEQKPMPASKETMNQVLNSIRYSFQANPTITLEYSNIEQINGRDFAVVKFVSLALDVPVYNEMAVTYLEGKTVICGFNCIVGLKSEWTKSIDKIINSIKIK